MLDAAEREFRRVQFMQVAEAISVKRLQRRVGARMQVLVDYAPGMGRRGGVGRSYADAPEIDGTVRLQTPEKISKTLKVGEFTQARVEAVEGHDLVAVPV
jgi:ribosomal protein S12 methylthiotransferase